MPVELKENEFLNVHPLYLSSDKKFPLISAVIQGRQKGQIFVDKKDDIKAVVVINNYGFTFAFGEDLEQKKYNNMLDIMMEGQNIKPKYILWYSPPIEWQKKILDMDLCAKERVRIRYEFNNNGIEKYSETKSDSKDFTLKRIDKNILPKTNLLGIDLANRFWNSEEDFCNNGIGTCLLKDEKVCSVCYSACVVDGIAEIDVITHPEYRGKGFAEIVTKEFISVCMEKKILPTWDCFSYNAGSKRLAQKLGFVEKYNYSFLSFNIPLKQ